MIKSILIVVVLALAGLLAFAATRADRFTVRRSIAVHAPPQKIHALINDLRQFNTWNPYEKKDPQIKGHYRGPAAGPGARYEFQGNQEVGAGSLEIITSAPQQVALRLDMTAPLAASNTITFTLQPKGSATEVTWAMEGASPYLAKLMSVFIDLDAMVGRDFEAGLANLKARAEQT